MPEHISGIYIESSDSEKENINDDVVFEMELIKQIEINIDYILELIRKYHTGSQEDKELLVDINKAIDSSVELRNKKELINLIAIQVMAMLRKMLPCIIGTRNRIRCCLPLKQ